MKSQGESSSGLKLTWREGIPRRQFLYSAALPPTVSAFSRYSKTAEANVPPNKMGIASTSFVSSMTTPPGARPQERDALQFLEKCSGLGAAGIQMQLNGDLAKLRARAEQLGMWIEGMVSVPRNGDSSAFERSLVDARTAGVKVVRTAMLSGRRYETFARLTDWKNWVDECHETLRIMLPILDRQKVTLAIENHKDWTLEDMQRLLRTYSSEYLGVCLDFGNNIALLDDPLEMVETLAPYAKSTHLKDMGVRPYPDGFLLSEVPLGTGLLDLKRMVSIVQKANPQIHFALEMMTRDPLKVPCLTPQYWGLFPDRNGRFLAQTLKLVQESSGGAPPLPTVSQLANDARNRIENDNVKACLQYERDHQLIS